MNPSSPDSLQSAQALLEEAKRGGELAKLIMAGTHHIESWLIENRILPRMREHRLATLHFATIHGSEQRQASLLPLPDGSAFACNVDGLWSALEPADALFEIEHIGARFAPGDRWQKGFSALHQPADGASLAASPMEIAALWEQVTGTRPQGFAIGALDEIEAIGQGIAEKLLHTRSRLGL